MKLLIPEPPLQVLPGLACAVGINEAVFLQQLHYWTERIQPDEVGQRWVYNTYAEWMAQFPWITSRKTFQRIVEKLERAGYIEVRQPNGSDRTNHYRLVYASLPESQGPELDFDVDKSPLSSGQIAPFSNTQETTSEKQQPAPSPTCSDEVHETWAYYETLFPSPRGKGLTPSRVRVIEKALKEFTVDELKRALDGAKAFRAKKPGGEDIADFLSTNPNSGNLTSRINWLIDEAEKAKPTPSEDPDELDWRTVRKEQGLD